MGKRIPPEKKALARKLYFDYEPVSGISKRAKLSEKTIEKWIHGQTPDTPKETTWAFQRKARAQELMQDVYDDDAKHHISNLWKVGLPLLRRTFETYADGMVLTLQDAEAVTRILMSFEKLRGAASGDEGGTMPTVPRAYTMRELEEAILKDKFFAIQVNVQSVQNVQKDVTPTDPFAPKGDA